MNDTFENQKEKLLAIKQEINLLHQQVNYLLRNEKALELLDLDVLMNRTHTIYDMLCSISAGEAFDEDDLPIDANAFSGLFNGMVTNAVDADTEHDTVTEPDAADEVVTGIESGIEEVAPVTEEPLDAPQEMVSDEVREEHDEETIVQPAVEMEVVQPVEVEEEHKEQEKPLDEEPVQTVDVDQSAIEEEKPLGDEFGFFFRFEDASDEKQETEEPKTEPVESTAKVVHVMEAIPEEEIPERDRVHGEDLVKDNPLEMPQMEDEKTLFLDLENERQSSAQVSDFFEPDDAGFEFATTETLGEKMMGEDHSLAARLQQTPGRDLKSVIGINDKFLFVNELFGGSMEKYNKSIDNLNDLKTLNGAMIYLNELKIELAWNSSNEAYQKLKDLVTHKFE